MAIAPSELDGFRIPDIRLIAEARAKLILQAARDFGVTAVESARSGQQFQSGPRVEHVRDGEVAVRLFGPDQAVHGLELFVDQQLGPEELPPIQT